MNGAGGRTNSKLTQYATSGSCIGAAGGVEHALKTEKTGPSDFFKAANRMPLN